MTSLHHDIVGTGPALVLLHGWAMHGGIFAPLVERLQEDFTLHVVDLPGHGHSARPASSLELADAGEQVAAIVPARALWLGWSLGGLVALRVTAKLPAQVRGLVMVAASPRFVRADDWPEGMDASVFRDFGRELGRDRRGTLDRFLMLEAQGSDHAREEIRLLRAEVFARGEAAGPALAGGLSILEGTDLREALPRLASPSLWVAGRRDRLVSPAAMRAAASLAPAASFHQVDGGGHAPFLTHAGEVADAIRAFAAGCPA